MMKVHRNSKGFTLIELLIVIAIIGILAAVAIPAYTGYTRKAKVQEVIHAMGSVKTAVMAYYTESGVGDGMVADGIAEVNTLYGVDIPGKYLAAGADAIAVNNAGVITATFNTVIGGNVSGTNVTLTPAADFKNWTWGGSLPNAYMPKS